MPLLPRFRVNAGLAILLLGINSIAILSVVFTLNYLHKQRISAAETESQNLSLAIDQAVGREVSRIDLSLQTVIGEISSHWLNDETLDHQSIQEVIDRQRRILTEANVWAVTDADGQATIYTGKRAQRFKLSDREYFISLKSGKETGLVVSKPILERTTGKWDVVLARAYTKNDGHFAGIVLISLPIAHFENTLSKFKIDPKSVLLLRDKTLGQIARRSAIDAPGTYVVGDPRVSKQIQTLVSSGAKQATYEAAGAYDKVERIFTYRLVDNASIYAIAGISKEDYLAEWYQWRWMSISFLGFFLLITDLSAFLFYRKWQQQRKTALALHASEREFRSLAENSPDFIIRYDRECRRIYVNQAVTTTSGVSRNQLLYQTPATAQLLQGKEISTVVDSIQRVQTTGRTTSNEIVSQSADGTSLWFQTIYVPEFDANGNVERVLAIGRNITDRKKMEESLKQNEQRMQHLAYHDPLTGLPNRILFAERLRQSIVEAKRANEMLAVGYLDLDDFKPINDVYSHELGDRVLVEIANRMKHILRVGDTVARIGGDEFALLLIGLGGAKEVSDTLQELLRAIGEPIVIDDHKFTLSASIGVSLYPEDGDNPDILLRNSDQTMYVAKRAGRNQYVFYGKELREKNQQRISSAHDLRQALDEGQITVHYQPIVDLTTGHISKAEALARWTHPTRGPVSPVEFIPLAEEVGLIHAVGDRVFGLTLQVAREWNRICPPSAICPIPRRISVNRSPRQFFTGQGLDTWEQLLNDARISGQTLTVEITEGLLLDDRAEVLKQLNRISDLGISLSLDDFGTGYSALSYLKKFSIDNLKIDRSFVMDMATDENDRAIVESIIAMAKRLGIQTIAEGVETKAQADLLIAAGCDMAQGYLYAKPMPAQEFLDFVRAAELTALV